MCVCVCIYICSNNKNVTNVNCLRFKVQQSILNK